MHLHDRSLLPFRSPQEPLGNYAIMVVTACIFAVQMTLDPGAHYLSGLILDRWSTPGLLGHFPAAYVAHIGGFLSGMMLAFCLPILCIVDCDRTAPVLQAMLDRASAKPRATALP